MMAAVGALVGPKSLLASLLTGMILGGLVAVVALWWRGCLGEKLRAAGVTIYTAVVTWSLAPLRAPAQSREAILLPYSVPLGLGTALALSVRCTLGA